MDAVPFLCEDVGRRGGDTGEGKRWLHALREYAEPPPRRRDADGRGQRRPRTRSSPTSRTTARRCTSSSRFLINQRLWLSLARGEAAPLEDLIRAPAGAAARQRLGDVPAQPRRADARQARRGRARRRVRRLRARGGHADLRPRDPPPRRLDARRRRPAAADGVVADAVAARHAGDPLRRRDRHGRGPRARGPDGGAHADASGTSVADAQRRDDRTRCCSVHDAALHRRHERPSSGWGRARCSRTSRRRCSRTAATGRARPSSRVHNLSGEPVDRRARPRRRTSTASTTCSSCASTTSRAGGYRVELDAYGYLWLRAKRAS